MSSGRSVTIRASSLFSASWSAAAIDVVLQLAPQLVGVREQLLYRAVLLDELRRGLLPHARDARDVVGRVALERHVLEVLRRRNAEPLLDGRLVVQDDVGDPAPVEHHVDPGTDELEEVAVRGHDHGVDPATPRRARRACRSRRRPRGRPRAPSGRAACRAPRRSSRAGDVKSVGVSARPALYSAYFSSRTVGAQTSNATAR